MDRTDLPPFRPVMAILTILAIGGFSVAGYVLPSSVLHVAALVLSILLLIVMLRRAAQCRSILRAWREMASHAQGRVRDLYPRLPARRAAVVATAAAAAVLTLAAFPLLLRSEVIRGADLERPGSVFLAYNRVTAPYLAELIELYVQRSLPLDQVDSDDLRILRNLYFAVEGYHFRSEDLQELYQPLIWYRPYRSYPNDLNALPEVYRQRVEQIMAIEHRRGAR